MNRRKIVLTTVLGMLGFAAIGSAAYVQSTVAYYREAGPCIKLNGVPGMLLAMHFYEPQCKSRATGPHAPCQDVAACHDPATTGTDKNGHCGETSPGVCGCIGNSQ